jgi:hypothetical protein
LATNTEVALGFAADVVGLGQRPLREAPAREPAENAAAPAGRVFEPGVVVL